MTGSPARSVTIVLPHRERFSPDAAGAVAMAVQRYAASGSRYRTLVVGPPVDGPTYPAIGFMPVRVPKCLPLTVTQSYALQLVRLLAPLPPGLIEVHNKPDVAFWLASCFRRRPVTLFLHNDPRQMRGARTPRARARLLARLAGVVTVSEFLRHALLDGVAADAVDPAPMVIHNTLDLTSLPPLLPAPEREPLILFAGRVVPDKAPDIFVAACALALPRLPGWRAEIIGADGFSPHTPDSGFIRALRPPAQAARVTLHGYQPHSAVLAAMARAAIVVVPSRWQEPFGMTALEAMACGAALICTAQGGLAEVAGDACIQIPPENASELAEAMLRLAADGALRSALSEAGRRRASLCFSADTAMVKLDDMRDTIMAKAARD